MGQPPAGTTVRVTVPATSANLGPGFDALGLALGLDDEVEAEVTDGQAGSLTIDVVGEGAADVPRDGGHLVVRAMDRACALAGVERPPLALRATNRIPHGRGLGSSAAAVVAGLVLARELIAPDLDDDAVLALASEIEGHPDNSAACLLGGLTIAWRDDSGVHAVRTSVSPHVHAVALVPAEALSTEVARGMLPTAVPHVDATFTAGRAALLVEALTRRPDLLMSATEDRLHQHYRAAAMPASADLLARLRSEGLAAVVSGAGPSLLVVTTGERADLRSWLPEGWRMFDGGVREAGVSVRRIA